MTKLLRAPDDWMAAWQAQADEEGLELTEWMRQQLNNGLSKQRLKGLSEPFHCEIHGNCVYVTRLDGCVRRELEILRHCRGR